MKDKELDNLCDEALEVYPDKVNNYHLGKTALIGLFVGEVMKLSNGKADPKKTHNLLIKKLNP